MGGASLPGSSSLPGSPSQASPGGHVGNHLVDDRADLLGGWRAVVARLGDLGRGGLVRLVDLCPVAGHELADSPLALVAADVARDEPGQRACPRPAAGPPPHPRAASVVRPPGRATSVVVRSPYRPARGRCAPTHARQRRACLDCRRARDQGRIVARGVRPALRRTRTRSAWRSPATTKSGRVTTGARGGPAPADSPTPTHPSVRTPSALPAARPYPAAPTQLAAAAAPPQTRYTDVLPRSGPQ